MRRWVGLVGALGLALAGAAIPGAAAVVTSSAEQPAEQPAVESGECLVDVPDGAQCGVLTVPENRADLTSRSVELPYVVVPARDPRPDDEPVVFMSGGPGSGTVQLAWYLTEAVGLAKHHDVILLEQRGGARATPSLDCPAAQAALADAFTRTDAFAAEAVPVATATLQCLDAFEANGGDPRGYGVAETAADVRDLRVALGYEHWSLYGVSWSTQVMSQVARVDPAGVESVVLDSFLVPGADVAATAYDGTAWVLESLAQRSGGTFDPAGDLRTAAAALDDRPEEIAGRHPITDEPVTWRITGDDLMTLVHSSLYDVTLLPVVPFLLDRLADGHRGALHSLIDVGVGELTSHTLGQYWTMQCQDEVPYRAAAQSDLLIIPLALDDVVCERLGLSPAAGAWRDPVAYPQPTLVLAGAVDPATPARLARDGAAGLPDHRFVEFAGVGHGVFLQSRCARTMIVAWLDDPGTDITGLCDPTQASYPVVDRDDLHPTSGVGRLAAAAEGGRWWAVVIPAVFALVAVGWLVGWLGVLVVRAIRRRSVRGSVAWAGLPAVASAALVAAAGAAVWATVDDLETTLLIGVPRWVPWLGLLLVVGAVGLVAAMRVAGRRGRVALAAAAVVWLAFAAWFVVVIVVPS